MRGVCRNASGAVSQIGSDGRVINGATRSTNGSASPTRHCIPPKYHNWAKLIPQITAQVIAAAKAIGATVLVAGNVYVYGTAPGPWGPDTPHRPNSRKGRIRAAMEAAYAKAATNGIRAIILRGADFIAPNDSRAIWNIITLKPQAKGAIIPTAPLCDSRGIPKGREV